MKVVQILLQKEKHQKCIIAEADDNEMKNSPKLITEVEIEAATEAEANDEDDDELRVYYSLKMKLNRQGHLLWRNVLRS